MFLNHVILFTHENLVQVQSFAPQWWWCSECWLDYVNFGAFVSARCAEHRNKSRWLNLFKEKLHLIMITFIYLMFLYILFKWKFVFYIHIFHLLPSTLHSESMCLIQVAPLDKHWQRCWKWEEMAQREPEKVETLSKWNNMLYSCRNTRNVTGCLVCYQSLYHHWLK